MSFEKPVDVEVQIRQRLETLDENRLKATLEYTNRIAGGEKISHGDLITSYPGEVNEENGRLVASVIEKILAEKNS